MMVNFFFEVWSAWTCFVMFFADDSACVALTDMPPRSEQELDPVTLHNQALMNIEQNPTEGFEKLQFLLQHNPFPPETFPNLLLLYVKYEVCEGLVKNAICHLNGHVIFQLKIFSFCNCFVFLLF